MGWATDHSARSAAPSAAGRAPAVPIIPSDVERTVVVGGNLRTPVPGGERVGPTSLTGRAGRRPARGGLPAGRVDGARLLPRHQARKAHPGGGSGGGGPDRAVQGAGCAARP